MKKYTLIVLTAIATNLSWSDTITNYVYVISNQYFRQVREITNRVSTVTYKTNVTVAVDVSDAAIARAEYEADRAERAVTNAMSIAEAAATSATASESSASESATSAALAASYTEQTRGAASSGIVQINSAKDIALAEIRNEKSWFEDHFGQMVTNINIYSNADTVARAGVQENSQRIDNLSTTISDMASLISNLSESVSVLNGRVDALSNLDGKIYALDSKIDALSNWVVSVVSEPVPTEKRVKEYWYKVYAQPYNVGTLMVSMEDIDVREPDANGQSFFYDYATSWVAEGTASRPYVSRREKRVPNGSAFQPYAEIDLTINGEVVSFVSYETGPDQYTFFTNSIERTYSNGRRCSITFDHIVYDE